MLSRIKGALCEIRDWLLVNKLKLNDSKTVAMILVILHSKYMQPPHNISQIKVGNNYIPLSIEKATNLGVQSDSTLSMDKFVISGTIM